MPRVAALDGLRGCAVLLVIAGHAAKPQNQSLGAVGVTLFFVLSGYLITTILLRERSATGRTGFLAFYGRRARRLLPALVLLLAFDSAVRLVTGQSLVPVVIAAFYGTNVATSFGYSSTLTHTWSLALEEQFYLIWPVLLPWVWRRRHGVALVLAAAALSAVARGVVYLTGPWTLAYFSPATRCDAILVGCALALAIAKGWRLPRSGALTAVAVATFAVAFVRPDLASAILIIPVASLASAVLVAVLLEPGRTPLHVLLSSPPLRYCGRVSYGMYLWHPLVLGAVVAAGTPLTFLTTTALTMALATVSWVCVERPWLTPFRSTRRSATASGPAADAATRQPSAAGSAAQVSHVG